MTDYKAYLTKAVIKDKQYVSFSAFKKEYGADIAGAGFLQTAREGCQSPRQPGERVRCLRIRVQRPNAELCRECCLSSTIPTSRHQSRQPIS